MSVLHTFVVESEPAPGSIQILPTYFLSEALKLGNL